MNSARIVHRAKRETDVSLIIFEREGRATTLAKPAPHLVGTLKIARLASGPSYRIEWRFDVRPE